MSPQLNQAFALARAGNFITVATPMTFVASVVALAVGIGLVLVFRWTRLGREWRAYADDPLAAEMVGVNPLAAIVRAFVVSRALARPGVATMTAVYSSRGS